MSDDWRRFNPQGKGVPQTQQPGQARGRQQQARQGAPQRPQTAPRGGAPFRPQPGQAHMMKHPPEKKHKHIKHPPKQDKPKVTGKHVPDYVKLALGGDDDNQDNPLWSLQLATAKRSIFWNNAGGQSWNRAKSLRRGSGAARKRRTH